LRLAIFATALAVRLISIEVAGAERVRFGDGLDYIDAARSLCVAHVYPARGNLPFFRAPGLPFFIDGVTACHPDAVRPIKYALAACDALTCVLIAMLFGRTRWLAGLIAALNPFFIASVCDVRSEPLFMLLLTAAIWLLLRRREALSGVALALAALTRPSALIAIPLFALFRPKRGVVLLIAAALTLAPWTIRNSVRFHELIVVNDAGGYNLWRGSNPELIRIESMPGGDAYREAMIRFESHPPLASSGELTRMAIGEMRAHPRETIAFTLRKAWFYWRPWLNPQEYDAWLVVASGVYNLLLFVFGAIGVARSPLRRAVIIFFTVMWLAHLPFQVVMRFRIPFTDPLLIAFAACALRRERADADTSDRSAAAAPA